MLCCSLHACNGPCPSDCLYAGRSGHEQFSAHLYEPFTTASLLVFFSPFFFFGLGSPLPSMAHSPAVAESGRALAACAGSVCGDWNPHRERRSITRMRGNIKQMQVGESRCQVLGVTRDVRPASGAIMASTATSTGAWHARLKTHAGMRLLDATVHFSVETRYRYPPIVGPCSKKRIAPDDPVVQRTGLL